MIERRPVRPGRLVQKNYKISPISHYIKSYNIYMEH